ncbi:MAG: hypothetical protein JSS66_13635 [Armatimonadetes bacterium]|nr:hypothetical protein [Armatimonadota bacterium]
MRPSLSRLLDHPIDYAGLYPPAQLDMAAAVREYLEVTGSPDAWIVNRFVCSASRLGELAKELRGKTTSPIAVTVVGSPLEGDPSARVRHDGVEIQEARTRGLVQIEAYEVRIPEGEGREAALAALRKLPSLAQDQDIEVFVEPGWGEHMIDTMHDAADSVEDVGFKARTGGVTADAFPSSASLASFLSECAALEAPFKFTAGLHQPVRYYDEALGVYHHGFLNAMVAGALAVTADLSRREIEGILNIDKPADIHFGVDDIQVGDHWLESDEIDEFHEVFHGFGSCSVQEPLDGLRSLGLLEGVQA